MPFTTAQRNTLLSLHVSSSIGWFGALLVFGVHAVAALTSADAVVVRGAAVAMQGAAWYVILPLALMSLFSGIVQAIGGSWGIARHYWIVIKLVLTVVATAVLLAKLSPIDALAAMAYPDADSYRLRTSLLVHAAGGLVILAIATILAIFKPVGRLGMGSHPPRWVKALAISTLALLALVLILAVMGDHGPKVGLR